MIRRRRCPLTCQRAHVHDQLMTWASPRLRASAHAALVAIAAVVLIVVGVVVIAGFIPRDALALVVSLGWGLTIAIIALGYYETRVKP